MIMTQMRINSPSSDMAMSLTNPPAGSMPAILAAGSKLVITTPIRHPANKEKIALRVINAVIMAKTSGANDQTP